MTMLNIAGTQSKSVLSEIKPVQIQPNAVDLKLDRVWAVEMTAQNYFRIDENNKEHARKTELLPDEQGYFHINPYTFYEVTFEGKVSIGPNEAGFVITRSTLNRNGLFITSGLYDSGYGFANDEAIGSPMAGALHNNSYAKAFIQKGTRVGQLLLWEAEALHSYDGSYGLNADGTVKADDLRYSAEAAE